MPRLSGNAGGQNADMPLSAVVLDIEGTTSATAYLLNHLYPYSAERLGDWIEHHRHEPDVARAVEQVRELIGDPAAGLGPVTAALLRWLAEDQKVTPLKTVQGRIWAEGFARGDLVAHFYPDVIPALRAWKAAGLALYVFSSGSVTAQHAWFGHSPEGDLRQLLSGYFDTANAGPKRAASSYWKITAAIAAAPGRTVFLSDVSAELDAARVAGWHTVGVRRTSEPHYAHGVRDHLEIASVADLDLSGNHPVAGSHQ
jgi:enolase-phosphatase E1